MEGYSDVHIVGCIRRNVRGAAADLLIPMGERAKVKDILKKFDIVFGEIQSTESVLREFYRATQESTETIAVWACRLEDLLSKVQCSSSVGSREEMLRSRFFYGINDLNIQSALRHHYDNGASFDKLLVAARRAEAERTKSSRVSKSQQVVTKEDSSSSELSKKLESVLAEMKSIRNRLDKMENQRTYTNSNDKKQLKSTDKTSDKAKRTGAKNFLPRCYECNKVGHKSYECPERLN